jgi:hypothetical protein
MEQKICFSNEGGYMMKKIRKIALTVAFVIFIIILVNYKKNDNLSTYTTSIESYTENTSYVEYPCIHGLKDKMKQDSINKLLKDQIFLGAKDYENKTFVDFSYPNYVFKFKSGAGFANKFISSFWYSFDGFGEVDFGSEGVMRDTYRFYGITIDMETGKKIDLSDFMVIDERLINSSDGNLTEPNYNSDVNPTFHNFKDAFMIYTSEHDKDAYHIFTSEEIIDMLKDRERETNWYIDENKNIVFIFGNSGVDIPYTAISDAIYPKYLAALKK